MNLQAIDESPGYNYDGKHVYEPASAGFLSQPPVSTGDNNGKFVLN
jgi:hypothetical protein